MLTVFNVYRWTGGRCSRESPQRSEDLIEHISAEAKLYATSPVLTVGDFDAVIGDLSPLAAAIQDGDYIDIGDSNFTDVVQNTCSSKKGIPTRRDYIIGSCDMVPFVKNFNVRQTSHPLHRRLELEVLFPDHNKTTNFINRASSITDALDQILRHKDQEGDHGQVDPKRWLERVESF